MLRVVFFGYPSDGHIYPTLGLVKKLVQRGVEVFYYATSPYKKCIEETKATYCSYRVMFNFSSYDTYKDQNIDHNSYLDRISYEQKTLLKLYEINNRIIRYQEYEIMKMNPQIIIYDTLCIWGKLISNKMRIPCIASHVDFIYTKEFREKDIRNILRKLNLSEHDVSRYYNKFSKFYENESEKESKIDSFDNYLELFYSDYLNITYLPSVFQPYDELLDKNIYKFIGYEKYPRLQKLQFPYKRLGEKPIIYISIGKTDYQECLSFYRLCFKKYKKSYNVFVVSINNKQIYNILKKENIPDNFIIKNYVPQIEILKRAGVFITNGGLSSIREAILYQVPLIVIPQNFDQTTAAKQVKKFGIGICLDSLHMSEEELQNHITSTYCNKNIIKNIKKLKLIFHKEWKDKNIVDYILEKTNDKEINKNYRKR